MVRLSLWGTKSSRFSVVSFRSQGVSLLGGALSPVARGWRRSTEAAGMQRGLLLAALMP